MLRTIIALSGFMLAGCATVDANGAADGVLTAIENARVRECPPERTQANARSEGFGVQSAVEAVDVALTPLAHDPSRAMRLRRIAVAPGGVIAWHDHRVVQGMALIVSGEMTELRNTCLDPIAYRAGDVAREDAETAHSWRNDGHVPAVIIVAHVVQR